MAAPVDSARQATNISSAATSHSISVGSPVAGTLLIVAVRFAAAPGTVTFTGYTLVTAADTSDATDDETRLYYRFADGAEGATDTLTTVNSVKLAAICWEITGASTVRAPVVSTVAVGTTAANTADATSVAPVEGSREYLFLAVAAEDGEVGTFSTAPTNYANITNANSGTGGAAATNCLLGGASRQLTAASDDPGVFTHGAAANGWTAYTVAIHPADAFVWSGSVTNPVTWDSSTAGIVPTDTAVAQISLGAAADGTPTLNTDHTIVIRARVTAGAGTIRAAIYEGASNRSGDLETSALTTSLATYELAISEANAANISDYSDLELRVWGFAAAGGAIVFEVAQAYLYAPPGPDFATVTGSVTFTEPTWTASTSGVATHYAAAAAPFTVGLDTAGVATHYAAADTPLAFGASVDSARKTFGASAGAFSFTADTAGLTTHYGALAEAYVFDAATGSLVTRVSSSTSPYAFDAATAGIVTARSSVTLPVTFVTDTAGVRVGLGSVTAPFTLDVAAAGLLNTFGSATSPFTLDVATGALLKTFGTVDSPFTFDTASSGHARSYGTLDQAFTLDIATAGLALHYAALADSYTWQADTNGLRRAIDGLTLPLVWDASTSGQVESGAETIFGALAADLTFDAATVGRLLTFGSLTTPFALDAAVTARVGALGALTAPFTWQPDVAALLTARSSVTAPFAWDVVVNGEVIGVKFGSLTSPFTLDPNVSGYAKGFGSLGQQFTLDTGSAGYTRTFGALALPLTLTVAVDGTATSVKYGAITSPYTLDLTSGGLLTARSALSLPVTLAADLAGLLHAHGAVTSPYQLTFDAAGNARVSGATGSTYTITIYVSGFSDITMLAAILTGHVGGGWRGQFGVPAAGQAAEVEVVTGGIA